jgi:hypothetical protein
MSLQSESKSVCIALSNTIQGNFTLFENEDLSAKAEIVGQMLKNLLFSYADILIKITPDSIRATKNDIEVQLDSTKRLFKVENLVLEIGEYIQITNLADLVRFRIAQKDGFLELKTLGLSDDEFSNGLLVQLNKIEPNLIEGSQIKKHRTSTLLINGQFVPVGLTETEFEDEEECWNVKEADSSRVFDA